jgi:enoyl-CoA hydratase/carnithine racemase
MAHEPAVRLDDHGPIARITFDQPNARANTLSRQVWRELGEAVAAIACRSAVRGVVLTSAKDGIWLAGADLRELAALPTDDPEPTYEVLRAGHAVLELMERLHVPSIAAIDGACLGGGLEVALACDYRIAGTHPKVKIGLPEVKLGLIPGWGGTQRLPRLIGWEPAVELLVTGRALSAAEAETLGVIDAVVPSAELWSAAVHRLTEGLPQDWSARRQAKGRPMPGDAPAGCARCLDAVPAGDRIAAEIALGVVEAGGRSTLDAGLRAEADAFVPLLAGEPCRERIAKFLAR